jgi:hypothetical protein
MGEDKALRSKRGWRRPEDEVVGGSRSMHPGSDGATPGRVAWWHRNGGKSKDEPHPTTGDQRTQAAREHTGEERRGEVSALQLCASSWNPGSNETRGRMGLCVSIQLSEYRCTCSTYPGTFRANVLHAATAATAATVLPRLNEHVVLRVLQYLYHGNADHLWGCVSTHQVQLSRGRRVRLSLVFARFVRAITPWHIEQRRRRPAHRLRSTERAELEIKLDQMARRSNWRPWAARG